MTTEQTRQLAIEFERRYQTMNPYGEIKDKLDTDTIYSYLNEYQDVYVDKLILSLYNENDINNKTARNILQSLTKQKVITEDKSTEYEKYMKYELPEDYKLYVSSYSLLTKDNTSDISFEDYKYASNTLIDSSKENKVLEQYYNEGGILRNPIIILENDFIKLFHDKYTVIEGINLSYIRSPHPFNILGYDNDNSDAEAIYSYCELPYQCFEELVSGAFDMFVTKYKYALKIDQPKQLEAEQ